MSPTDVADKIAPKKPARSRKPLPAVDPAGTTSAVDALAAVAPFAVDQVVHVAPTTLLIGPNVRKTTDPVAYKALVDSISELGVLEAVTAFVTEDGQLEVITGQTRTNAAVEAGRATIPVRIVAKPESTTLTQLVENTARAPMTRADQVAAAKQLAFEFKLPAAQIAKRTTLPRKDIDHALKVADAPVALAGLEKDGLSLELLAAVADADLTEEEAQRVYSATYNPEMTLRRIAKDKATRAAIDARVLELSDAGVSTATLTKTDQWGQQVKAGGLTAVEDLVDADGAGLTVEAHRSCPGHTVWVGVRDSWSDEVAEIPVCLDPKVYGHKTGTSARGAAGGPSEEQRAAEKAEKKLKTHLNKAWPEVTDVRLDWIRDHLLPLKKLPTGWQLLVADDLMEEHDHSGASLGYGSYPVALNHILNLGVEVRISEHTGTKLVDAHAVAQRFVDVLAKRPDHAILALTIYRHEAALVTRGGWERVSTRYLRWLVDNGYRITEEEQIVLDRISALEDRRRTALVEDEEADEEEGE